MTVLWKGWAIQKPGRHQRTVMARKCGKKCFLGKNNTFPICIKNTCKRSKKGVYAAYIRSSQYRRRGSKYRKIAKTAKHLLLRL